MVIQKSKRKILILKTFRYTVTFATLLLLASASKAQSTQHDTVWWYQSGKKEIWYKQQDAFAFTTQQQNAFTLEGFDDIVLYQYFREKNADKMNVIYFKPDASLQQIETAKQAIKSNSNFKTDFPIITLKPDSNVLKAQWLLVDNLLLIKFKNSNVPNTWLNDFRMRYNLSWQNPEIKLQNSGANHTYIFMQNAITETEPDVIALSKKIYEHDSAMILQALPNKIMAFQPVKEDTSQQVILSVNIADMSEKDYYVHVMHNDILKVFFRDKNAQSKKSFKIYDSLGQLLFDKSLHYYENNDFFIRIHEFATGIYFTIIESENGNMLYFQKFKKN